MKKVKAQLSADLNKAIKRQDAVAVKALRILMSAIDNAGAVVVETSKTMPMSGKIAGATSGLYSTEVQRKDLSDEEIGQIIKDEIAETAKAIELINNSSRLETGQLAEQILIFKKYL